MRSPSVDRLICSSSAARDLLPPLTFNAHADQVRLDLAQPIVERDRRRRIAGRPAARPASAGCPPARNRMLADMQPTRTVPHVQVCAIRSQAFSSSRTLPGQLYRMNACLTASETAGTSSLAAPEVRARGSASISTGMSSRRSRSGGSVSGSTFSR